MDQVIELFIIAPPILLALSFHEFAHAWMADRLGDPTARQLGRLTLNPFVHLDLIGTVLLFIINIGWAKPVPINPLYFKHPKRDLLQVSLAGPGANLLLALFFGLGCRLFNIQSLHATELGIIGIVKFIIAYGMIINVVLACFNLLPIPPLDGSKILLGLIPQRYEGQLKPLLKYGTTGLLVLIIIGFLTRKSILWSIINPFVKFFSKLFAGTDLML